MLAVLPVVAFIAVLDNARCTFSGSGSGQDECRRELKLSSRSAFFVTWAGGAVVLLIMGAVLAYRVRRQVFGILIDQRGRYSLSRFQVVCWTVVLIPLFAALFVGRLVEHAGATSLQFSIPSELLGALGISLTSAVTAQAIKSSKDQNRPESIPASTPAEPPRFGQLFLVEQGDQADKIIDVTKFQNFWITLLVLAGYLATVISTINAAQTVSGLALPGFSGTLLTLLGISHAGYLAGKIPDRVGVPPGPTVLSTSNPDAIRGDEFLLARAAEPRKPVRAVHRALPTPPPRRGDRASTMSTETETHDRTEGAE
jgi:hypothetical protein